MFDDIIKSIVENTKGEGKEKKRKDDEEEETSCRVLVNDSRFLPPPPPPRPCFLLVSNLVMNTCY